jgi:hypothetical protein
LRWIFAQINFSRPFARRRTTGGGLSVTRTGRSAEVKHGVSLSYFLIFCNELSSKPFLSAALFQKSLVPVTP